MNRTYWIFGLSSILLLAGGGCGNTTTPQINSKPAETVPATTTEALSPTVTTTVPVNTSTTTINIELTGTALGKNMVQFNWTIPEGIDPKVLHLVRGQNENPTQPPSNWYKVDGKSRSAIWTRLARGSQHFRICIWENNKCESYSNDVLVDVK